MGEELKSGRSSVVICYWLWQRYNHSMIHILHDQANAEQIARMLEEYQSIIRLSLLPLKF
jgi:hypothetical protein